MGLARQFKRSRSRRLNAAEAAGVEFATKQELRAVANQVQEIMNALEAHTGIRFASKTAGGVHIPKPGDLLRPK
jgi:hypothetical protein